MKYKVLILSFILLLLVNGCDSIFDSDDEWDESEEEVYYDDEQEEPDSDEFDDDQAPIFDNDELFLRDFSLPLPLFSADSAWNQRADQAAVLPESDAQMLSFFRMMLGDHSSLRPKGGNSTDWPYMSIGLYEFTIPIFRAGDEMQDVWICQEEGVVGWANPKYGIETEGGPVTVPAPAVIVRPAGPEVEFSDGHLVLYHPDSFMSYDYIWASPHFDEECYGFVGGMVGERILQAGEVDFFDVRGQGVNPDGVSSARAVGTPLLAGLILPEDIESGAISHALAFANPGPRNTSINPQNPHHSDYFYPASTTETDYYSTNSDDLASGQRLRLKQTIMDEEGQPINENQLAPITQMFLSALREYGAYLVDGADGFSFYAEDVHTAVLHLSDNEINVLIGEPPGTPLAEGMTKWQIVIEKLANDLELIPLAVSEGDSEPIPKKAQIEFSNFEVVEPAFLPE